ncbi:probable flavin-containing monoamine oxidase A [Haliotis cracherodii]|uniref:probable flavin-containing monoamine oxidase A n=1 Tax=Haliotis cracherodii TaxID=6455 RepID=UPI0039E91B22
MSTTKCDVVVVGAGISGMAAAYRLKKKDQSLHVVVLEAKDRVGGRTQTVPMKAASGTDHWDLGGQWVGRCQPHIMALLEELQLKIYPQFLQGIKFMQLADHTISSYKSDIPSLSVLALIDLQRFINKIDELRREVNVEDPWLCRHAAEWDAITMDTFIQQTMWTKGAKEAVESAGRCMMGIETTQVSLLFYLMYVSAADGIKNLVEATEFTAQEFKIQGGSQQVSQRMVSTVGAMNVNLDEPVSSIIQNETGVTVKTVPGHKYECKRVICAVPPPALGHIDFHPLLPPQKQELIKRMPLGNMIKVIITYRTAFWREQGQSGEAVSNGGPSLLPCCDSGPLCIVYDATSPKGNPALVGFLGGHQAVQWAATSAVDRQHCVLHQLSTYFGQSALEVLEYQEKDWNVEPYTRGGPVCCLGTGAMQYFAAGLREPVNRVHFAGTETATQWCGYMSGAVQAGYRTAIEVLSQIHPDLVSQDDHDLYASRIITPKIKANVPWIKLTLCLGVCVAMGFAVSKRGAILSLISPK